MHLRSVAGSHRQRNSFSRRQLVPLGFLLRPVVGGETFDPEREVAAEKRPELRHEEAEIFCSSKKSLQAHPYNSARYNFHNSSIFVKRVIADVHLASPIDPIGAAGAMKKRAAIRINAKGRKLEENERRVVSMYRITDNFANIAPLFQMHIELISVLISELHGQTAATHCESTCSLVRRRNIMLRLEDEGTRRPLMHVHIRYWLRSSIRIASVPLLAADCCTSAYPGLCGDIHNANRKNLRYDSFGYKTITRIHCKNKYRVGHLLLKVSASRMKNDFVHVAPSTGLTVCHSVTPIINDILDYLGANFTQNSPCNIGTIRNNVSGSFRITAGLELLHQTLLAFVARYNDSVVSSLRDQRDAIWDIETIAYSSKAIRGVKLIAGLPRALFSPRDTFPGEREREAFVEHQQIGKSQTNIDFQKICTGCNDHRRARGSSLLQAAHRNTEAHDSKCSIIDFWETRASSGRGPDSPLSSDLALDKPRSIPSPSLIANLKLLQRLQIKALMRDFMPPFLTKNIVFNLLQVDLYSFFTKVSTLWRPQNHIVLWEYKISIFFIIIKNKLAALQHIFGRPAGDEGIRGKQQNRSKQYRGHIVSLLHEASSST
ncbi:hypothetical protein G5I_02808 [Acromyrmex echinatior]|uniref:Uncharacterized protein n=1 Tax=Acromyrmex echinatior TaxID=103372 RepID=F4WBA1_ACREC|nr:hypothetical protein G5I_02808 [Acromyrmex echinatior]